MKTKVIISVLTVLVVIILISSLTTNSSAQKFNVITQAFPGPGYVTLKQHTFASSPSGNPLTINASISVGDLIVASLVQGTTGPNYFLSTNGGDEWDNTHLQSNQTQCDGNGGAAFYMEGTAIHNATNVTITPNPFSAPMYVVFLVFSGVDYVIYGLSSSVGSSCNKLGSPGTSLTHNSLIPSIHSLSLFFWNVEGNLSSGFSISGSSTVDNYVFPGGILSFVVSEHNNTAISTGGSLTTLSWTGSKDASAASIVLVPLRVLGSLGTTMKGSSSSGSILLNVQYGGAFALTNCPLWRTGSIPDIAVIFLSLSASTSISFAGSSGIGTPGLVRQENPLMFDSIYIADITQVGCGTPSIFITLGTNRAYILSIELFRNAKTPVPAVISAITAPSINPFGIFLNATRPENVMAAGMAFQGFATIVDSTHGSVGQLTSAWLGSGASGGSGFVNPMANFSALWSVYTTTNVGPPSNADMLAVVIGANYISNLVVSFTNTHNGVFYSFFSHVIGAVGLVNYSWDFDTINNPNHNVSSLANPTWTFAIIVKTYCVRLNVTDQTGNTGTVTNCLTTSIGSLIINGIDLGALFWLLMFVTALILFFIFVFWVRRKRGIIG